MYMKKMNPSIQGEKNMELIIKETGYTKEEACKKEPVFKIEDGVLVDCNLNGSKIVTIPADVIAPERIR